MEIKTLEFDRHKQCRVCLQRYSEMCQIFDEGNEYQKMLRECGRVEVEENDGLPVVICEYCVQEMTQAHHFLTKCQDADRKLRISLVIDTKEGVTNVDNNDIANVLSNIIIKADPDQPLFDIVDNNELAADSDSFSTKSELVEKSDKFVRRIAKRKKGTSVGYPKKCVQCSLIVKCKSTMIIHMRTHTNERPYQCSDCGECFKTKGVLKAHMAVHRDKSKEYLLDSQRKFQCKNCKKVFLRKADLVNHDRVHTGETPYSCKLCKRAFTQLSSMLRHLRRHTNIKPYKCSTCGKSFCTSDGVKKHSTVHTNVRNFSCNDCGILFKAKSSLATHIAAQHENTRTVVCDQCGMLFNARGNLKQHLINVHSERAGRCDICNKDYSNIIEHNRQHTGETPYQCNICDKKFSTKNSLKIHKRKHSNPEKYPCEYEKCTKSFPMKCMLTFHILKYHKKQTPYICKHCNRGFYRLSDLKRHLKLNHSDQPNILEDIKEVEISLTT